MAGFYNAGDRKVRPGVYARIVNNGVTMNTVNVTPPLPPSDSGSDDPVATVRLSVSSDGVLRATGKGFSLGSDGHTVVFAADINAVVSGEMITVNH